MSQFLFRQLIARDLSWYRLMRSLLFIYTLVAIFIFVRSDSLIFMPQPVSYQDTTDILKLSVNHNEQISAVYLPNSQAGFTVLYIHGNAEDLGDIRPVLARLHRQGFSVFAYDYRGYGTSNGTPGEANAYRDAEVAYTYLTKQLNIPADRIIVYGRSLGGGSATEIATRYPVAGLILESTFTSAFRLFMPFPLLPFDKFTNLDKLQKVHCPVLVMHGQADRLIPIQQGRSLYEAASEPKMSLWVADAGHNDFADVAGDRYRQTLLSFQQLVNTDRQTQ
jgi:abhydrolase domain-containing protein 17